MTRWPIALRRTLIGLVSMACLALPARPSAMAACGGPTMERAAASPTADLGMLDHKPPGHGGHRALDLPCCTAGACAGGLPPSLARIMEPHSGARLRPAASDALLQGIAGAAIDPPPRRAGA